MQLTIDPSNAYCARYSLALSPVEDEVGCASGRASAGAAQGQAGVDADVASLLRLLPGHIQDAVLRLCCQPPTSSQRQGPQAGIEPGPGPAGGAAGASGSSSGGRGSGRPRRALEVVVDLGRSVAVRFDDGSEEDLAEELGIEDALQSLAEAKGRLDHGGARARELFYGDNRTGVPGTLHRISAMRGRDGEVLGLTYRIGRHVPGMAHMVLDVLAALSVGHPHADATGRPSADEFVTPSLLLLGPPGVGKTTLLRDVANTLADTFRKRVVVVDNSNEIAGDASKAHPCIGRAQRMMVPERAQQHAVLIEACQNHTPQVVIVDEIGTSREMMAAKSIGQRGVVMVGTAHGTCLEGLLRNPELNALVGGVHEVVLGDEEARRSNAGGKTRLERRGAPAFSTLLEVLGCNRWRLHMNVACSVDAILAGREPVMQLRWLDGQGRMMARVEGVPEELPHAALPSKALRRVAEQQGARGAWLHDLINLAAAY